MLYSAKFKSFAPLSAAFSSEAMAGLRRQNTEMGDCIIAFLGKDH